MKNNSPNLLTANLLDTFGASVRDARHNCNQDASKAIAKSTIILLTLSLIHI